MRLYGTLALVAVSTPSLQAAGLPPLDALQQGPLHVVPGPAGSDCSGGLIYDDGTLEDAFTAASGGRQNTKIVQLVTPTPSPARLTQVCLAFTRVQDLPNNASMDFTVDVFAVDGPPGQGLPFPGTLLARIPAHIDDIPLYPATRFYAIDTSAAPPTGGSVYVGASWNPDPNGPSPGVAFAFDTTAATTPQPIFTISDVGSGAWAAMTNLNGTSPNYLRSMSIRAQQASVASLPPKRPAVTAAFVPAVVLRGTPSTLTLTLTNRNPDPATLGADFIDDLPAGLVIATTPNAMTDCGNGVAAATSGSSSAALGSGAVIPASGSCTLSVSVVPSVGGKLTDTIAADSLQTDLGNNSALPAEASLIVTTGGGSGGSVNENFDTTAVPDLPPGWTSPVAQGLTVWTTTSGGADSTPHAVHAPDGPRHSDFSLLSPAFVVDTGALLRFRHKYEFENDVSSPPMCYDGGVLEISTDGGASFSDIVAAGGVFESGAYTCTIEDANNPLGSRQGWGGTTGAQAVGGPLDWVEVNVNLGAFVGQNIVLRWRQGSDTSNSFYSASGDWPGWWIDSIRVGTVDAIFRDGFEAKISTVAPTVATAFAAGSVPVFTPTPLTITLTNSNATAATLTADLLDVFPSGIVSAANASTTCTGGPGLSQSGISVALLAGAVIPATGSCTVSLDVAANAAGTFTNTIPAGGLVTTLGSNATAASATLTVTNP